LYFIQLIMKAKCLCILFLVIGCSYDNAYGQVNLPTIALSLQTNDAIPHFWQWFSNNQTRLTNFELDPNLYLNELLIQVKKISPGLAIELEPAQQGIIPMTISADGDRNLFPVVQQIAANAPKIPGWKFIAFRQRMNIAQLKTMKVKTADYELDPAAMKFFPVESSDSLDIIIYINGITKDNFNEIAYQGLLLLDNILGEYDCAMKISAYDFHEMPDQTEVLKELKPLLSLPAYIDLFYEQRKKK